MTPAPKVTGLPWMATWPKYGAPAGVVLISTDPWRSTTGIRYRNNYRGTAKTVSDQEKRDPSVP